MKKKEERCWVVFENHGQKIFGVLHKPLVSKKVPVVILCHGFGGDKVGRFRYFVKLAENLAENHIACLRFDFRGFGDSEGDAVDLTIKGQVEDLHKAIDFLKSDPLIDMSKLGVLGRSLGGAISVIAASEREEIRSIALWVPLFSTHKWKEKLEKPNLGDGEKSELLHLGGKMPNKEFLQEFFSLRLEKYLEKISHIPLFHAHGGKDVMIDESHTNRYSELREKASAITKMVVYPKQDHHLTNPEELQKMIQETVHWFKDTLR